MDRHFTNNSPRSQRQPEPDPFRTRVIPYVNAWWGLGICAGGAIAMLVLVLVLWKNAFDGFKAVVTFLGLVAAFLAFLFGLGQSFYHLIFKFHLVLTRDSVQLRNRDGDILGQIPYHNVDSLDVVTRREQAGGVNTEVLKIILRNADDRKTWWKD